MNAYVAELTLLVVRLTDRLADGVPPEPEDVKAGWTAFVVFVLLIVAVGLLGWSLTRHLRKAEANEEAGLFGSDEPRATEAEAEPRQAP